jgi:hypothetical protein
MTAITCSRRGGNSAATGTSYGILASRILRVARTSRCAMVSGVVRNARAISSVVSPPSVRRVRATCASSASAGWQQVNRRRKRSSRSSSGSAGSWAATAPADTAVAARRRTWRRRIASMIRRRATATNQARGVSGRPAPGQVAAASANASWTHSSARSKSPPVRRMAVARTAACSARKIRASALCAWALVTRASIPGGARRAGYSNVMTGRISMQPRRAPGIRAAMPTASSRSLASMR